MFDFVSYMRNLAEKSKYIQHSETNKTFHRITNLQTLEEVIQNNQNISGAQLIVEDVMEGLFRDNNGTMLDNPVFRFYIVKRADQFDFDAKEIAKRECKTIAKKLISRIRKNHYSDRSFETTFGLANLENDSFQYFSIGPLLDFFWGVEVSFSIVEAAEIKYSNDDWTD